MLNWIARLGEGCHRVMGTWCAKHSMAHKVVGCPACVREKMDGYELLCKNNMSDIIKGQQLIAVVAMDNTIKAVKMMLKQSRSKEELEKMLDEYVAFKSRS